MFDLFRRQLWSCFRFAARIPDCRRKVPNDKDNLVPEVLKLAQFA